MKIKNFQKKILNHTLTFKIIYNHNYSTEFSNESVILLHHGLGSIEQWKNFPHLLYEKIKIPIILYNRVGYNKNSNETLPDKFLYYEAFNILPEIIHSFQLKNYLLVGHSDGATISLLFASKQNNGLKKIIAIAPHVLIEKTTIKELNNNLSNKDKILSHLKKYHCKNTEALFTKWHNYWLNKNKKWNIYKYLKKIKVPILVIQGKHDEFGTIEQIKKLQDYCICNFKIIENCKHFPHIEYPENVLNAIVNFLNS